MWIIYHLGKKNDHLGNFLHKHVILCYIQIALRGGMAVMKKRTDKIADFLEYVAEKHANSASTIICYEPKVPEKLAKELKTKNASK